MKTRILSLLVFTAAFTAFASAAPAAKPASSHPVGSVERLGRPTIERGALAPEVLQSLGQPKRKLGEQMWIYPNFDAGFVQAPDDDCRTLVVTFTNGRVSNLQLVNDRAENIFAARVQALNNAKVQVAAK